LGNDAVNFSQIALSEFDVDGADVLIKALDLAAAGDGNNPPKRD
jgi:hypothetical protein